MFLNYTKVKIKYIIYLFLFLGVGLSGTARSEGFSYNFAFKKSEGIGLECIIKNESISNFNIAGIKPYAIDANSLFNQAPEVFNAFLTGEIFVGQTLTASYTYSDADNDPESGSILKWYRSDDVNGTNRVEIAGAVSLTYTLQSADIGKYIVFEVKPKDGKVFGEISQSNVAGPIIINCIGQLFGSGYLTGGVGRDEKWKVISLPQGYTPAESLPYNSYVLSSAPPLAGSYTNISGYDFNGKRYYWIAPNNNANSLVGGSYNWIVEQTFFVPVAGFYDLFFSGGGDNAIEFHINGEVDDSNKTFPIVKNSTQIGQRWNSFTSIGSFSGKAYLKEGMNKAQMVMYDFGGLTAALISGAEFNCSDFQDSDGDGIEDPVDPFPTQACLPLQNRGYKGYIFNHPVWSVADCDGDGTLNGIEHSNGTDPYRYNFNACDSSNDLIAPSLETKDITIELDERGVADLTSNRALYTSGFEEYQSGNKIGWPVNSRWEVYSKTESNAGTISTEQASAGSRSLKLQPLNNLVLQVADKLTNPVSDNRYLVKFDYFLPTGSTGYVNLQCATGLNCLAASGAAQFIFGTDGSIFPGAYPTTGTYDLPLFTWDSNTKIVNAFPSNQWFSVALLLDGVQQKATLFINEKKVHTFNWITSTNFTGVNFSQVNGAGNAFIDNLELTDLNGVNTYGIIQSMADACNLSFSYTDKSSFDASSAGTNAVKVYLFDLAGNSTVKTANVTLNKKTNQLKSFSKINKLARDDQFTIKAPKTNSLGAITYVSSDASVATITGNQVTLVGPGTATIRAEQAGDAIYNPASIETLLTVVDFPKLLTTNGEISPKSMSYLKINGGKGDAVSQGLSPSGQQFKIKSPESNQADLKLWLDASEVASYNRKETAWYDLSPEKNNGILKNNTSYSSSLSKSFNFNGLYQFVQMEDTMTPTDVITYESWIYPTGLATGKYNSICMQDGAGTGTIHFQFYDFKLYMDVNFENKTYASNYTFSNNRWYHVAAVYSKSAKKIKFYVNSLLTNEVSLGATAPSIVSQPFKIGSWDGTSRFFKGNIATFKIYSRELSSAEISINAISDQKRFGLTLDSR